MRGAVAIRRFQRLAHLAYRICELINRVASREVCRVNTLRPCCGPTAMRSVMACPCSCSIGTIDVHPVEEQQVEMDIQVERGPKPLHQRHRAGAGDLPGEPGLLDPMHSDDSVDDVQYLAHDRQTAGKQKPERERHTQHPLAHRLMRQDYIHQQGRTLGHAPRPATGTIAAAFAAERHQVFGMAGFAAQPQKAVFKTAEFKVIAELPLDMAR